MPFKFYLLHGDEPLLLLLFSLPVLFIFFIAYQMYQARKEKKKKTGE